MSTLQETVDAEKRNFQNEYQSLKSEPEPMKVEDLRVRWTGRKGLLTKLLEGMRDLKKEERPQAGKLLNEFRLFIENSLSELKKLSLDFQIDKKLKSPPLDVTLPIHGIKGSLHPITLMTNLLTETFQRMGFSIYDGPETDFEHYNFNSLNIPEHHPARDMQDTFFLTQHKNLVMRTHTSNIQIHSMLREKPPLRLISLGKVFRVDSDATHTPMFHQIESVFVDKGVSLANLKGLINSFLQNIFGSDIKTRLRPSYFPFVEPGAEVDMQCSICRGKGCRVCKQTGWLEIAGSGMIHPNVFKACGVDHNTYSGFAFGFGIDRMAMLAMELDDLRQMFEGDYTYQQQFPIYLR